jgi:hypothetical protein
MSRPRSIPGVKKPVTSRITMRPVKTTPLVEYMTAHEGEGKTSRELILEFREQCGHDFKEIAYLVIDGTRMTYQGCQICGLFVKARKGASLGKASAKAKAED